MDKKTIFLISTFRSWVEIYGSGIFLATWDWKIVNSWTQKAGWERSYRLAPNCRDSNVEEIKSEKTLSINSGGITVTYHVEVHEGVQCGIEEGPSVQCLRTNTTNIERVRSIKQEQRARRKMNYIHPPNWIRTQCSKMSRKSRSSHLHIQVEGEN